MDTDQNQKINKKNGKKDRRGFLSRYSVRAQFTLAFLAVMMAVIVLILIFNECFLEKFYMKNKETVLRETFEQLNEAATDDQLNSDSYDVILRKTAGPDNIAIVVLDSESVTVMSYSTDARVMLKRLYDCMFGLDQVISDEDADALEKNGDSADTGIQETDSGNMKALSNDKSYRLGIIEETSQYTLQEVFDATTESRYMELWGTLDNGYFFLLRTPLESIKDSAFITMQFFLITALIATIIGIILSLILGGKITQPIRELTTVSDRMKQLDFSAQYTGKSRTEIGELGENINEMSRTLERTISELKTANAALRQDIKKREEIDAMRKEFLSNVTHELKTPIALIQGYAEGLEDCVNDDAESRNFYAGVIVDEAGKMNTMVQKLLSLNHLEFGEETANMEHFDVLDLIDRYLKSAQKLSDEKNAKVVVEPAPGTEKVVVWSDSFLVEEAFTNYFSNACNHVAEDKDGTKLINIRVTSNDESGKVRISVFNTGEPIPEESLSRIWEKFYKVDKARTRAYGGSGIGLSIVAAIMGILGEDYGVKNFDNGVEFYFELDKRNDEIVKNSRL